MNQKRRLLLGIGGGIAAYKTPDLVRKLSARNFDVIPVLTEAGKKFVAPHSLSAVSGNRVRSDLWDLEAEQSMGHIELARWADAMLIAPATAGLMAKMAHGIADDLLTTICLATQSPIVVAPAMNQAMWQHSITQANVSILKKEHICFIDPEEGEQACGDVGPGRMSEPESIANYMDSMFTRFSFLEGLNVVVTAGPTREYLDPIRFLSNKSSGKQGFAIANAAARAGAKVTLITGPVNLETPPSVSRIDVESAASMKDAVLSNMSSCDLFFSVAAVADYQPIEIRDKKLKKQDQPSNEIHIDLVETTDVLQAVAKLDNRPLVVGFAAETENVLEYGEQKFRRKNLDAIVINDVSDRSIGFESDENEVTIIYDGGHYLIPKRSKADVANDVVKFISSLHTANSITATQPI